MFETELLEILIRERQQELELLLAARSQSTADSAVTAVSDPEVALRVFQYLGTSELRILIRPPDRVSRLLLPGMHHRTVYDSAALPSTADSDHLRVAADLPITLMLADRVAAWVPGLLIRDDVLLDALGALFDSIWSAATPGNSTEPDRELLSLLVAGLTDEAAGARLGLSRRTVARRVQHLMNVTGARSRLQLGWYAHERNWL